MADQPDQPNPPDPLPVAGVPGSNTPPEEPTRKADIDRLLGGGLPGLTAQPLPAASEPVAPLPEQPAEALAAPLQPTFDLRAELAAETSATDQRATTEVAAPQPLTAEVVQSVEALSTEAATALVIGPSPHPSKVKPDAAPLHRKTVPAQSVEEAQAKAGKAMPGKEGAAPVMDPEDAKKAVEAEFKRVTSRLDFSVAMTKELQAGFNPMTDPEFQKFVRSHLAHLFGFYIVTGQPTSELRADTNEKTLAEQEEKLMADFDPALRNNPAARHAALMGFRPNAEETE